MKKYVLFTLILILVPLYAFDVYLHNWTKSQFIHTMQGAFPRAQKINVGIGSDILNYGDRHFAKKPMIPGLVFGHKIPEVTLSVQGGTNLGTIPIDTWSFTADNITFDSNELFDSKIVFVKEVSNGYIQMLISQRSLGNISPGNSVSIDGSGHATANIGGANVPLEVSATKDSLVFTANGQTFATIPTASARLLPCQPDAHFVSHGLLLSCATNHVPGALSLSATS